MSTEPQKEAPTGRLGKIRAARRRLPENVRVLGWVSLANDSASELAYPIVPLFLTITLGAPVAIVGLIEGVAEAMALGVRLLSGWLSDRAGNRRRPWIVAGYGLSTAARAVIAAAPAWGWVLGGKVIDRIGKGARSTPRDALIRDSTPKPLMGSAFGYHRAMDTTGAVIGPLIAVVLLELGLSLREILWFAVLPGLVTLLVLRQIREAPAPAMTAPKKTAPSIERGRVASLPASFWSVLAIWVVFSLGNSSDAFLLLRAHQLGLATLLVVLAYAGYNVVYASLSWPLGALSDRIPRVAVIAGGVVVFGLVYVGFAVAPGTWAIWPLFAIYGIFVAATEGVGRAWVADHVESGAVGTAYGIFYACTAAAALVASIVAGLLWTYVSPEAPFVYGAITATVAALLLGAYGLSKEVGARAAQVLLVGLAVVVVAGAAIEHGRLTDLFRHGSGVDLPVAAARACGPAPGTTSVRLPSGFPRPAGVEFTDDRQVGPSRIVQGFVPGDVRAAHGAYVSAFAPPYDVTREELDPADAEVDFAGSGTTGEVKLVQECRDRTHVKITIRPR